MGGPGGDGGGAGDGAPSCTLSMYLLCAVKGARGEGANVMVVSQRKTVVGIQVETVNYCTACDL
jgi:hypothetical protein